MEQYVKYLRKSRFDRDYAELSIEETLKRHEAILDKLAAQRGYYIAKTYYEVVSGESIAARPEIQKLLEEVNAGFYAGVLVVDVERLARGNGADQAYISQVFQFSGTKIITPTKIYDPSNEFDEEYFEFGLFMSRREYKTINRRLIRGRDSSASEGKWIGICGDLGADLELTVTFLKMGLDELSVSPSMVLPLPSGPSGPGCYPVKCQPITKAFYSISPRGTINKL